LNIKIHNIEYVYKKVRMLSRMQCDISFRHLDFSLILKACLLEGMGGTQNYFSLCKSLFTFLVDMIQVSVPVLLAMFHL